MKLNRVHKNGDYLILKNVLNPFTWIIYSAKTNKSKNITGFKDEIFPGCIPYKNTFIDVDHDFLGQRKYISLLEAY